MIATTTKYKNSAVGKIKISQASTASCFKGVTSGLAVKFVLDGRECYEIGNTRYYLSKGQFIILNEAENYKVFTKNENTKGCCLDFNLDIMEYANMDLLFNQPYTDSASWKLDGGFNGSLTRLSTACFNGTLTNPRDVIQSLAKEVLHFNDELEVMQQGLLTFTQKKETQKLLISKLMLARDYIQLNYTNKISLEELSSLVGISKYHFTRVFKSCFGKSPLVFQEEIRMIKAKELILQDNKPLSEIAYLLGYYDLASFSKKIKSFYKITPSSFRK